MPDALVLARSLLFVPGSDESKLAKALMSPADAVVADLEDAVAPDAKEAARALVVRVLGEAAASGPEGRPALIVRVNGVGTPYHEEDMRALAELELDAIMLPKATPEAVAALGEGPPVVALVETAAGLRQAYETACSPRVVALALGAADLGVELSLVPRPDGIELLFARSALVVDSAAAGIRAPFDAVCLDTRDSAGLEREAALARSLGFGGKLCIHPAQLDVVNRTFAPSEEQVAWARAALAAYEEALQTGRGAASLHGELVDAPVAKRARAIIEAAGRESA